jgi:rsbT antagonist protein RsbS
MSVAIIRQGDHLIVSVQSALSDEDWLLIQRRLADQAGRERALGVAVDVGLLDVLDSFAARMLQGIARTLRLRGVETVVVGIAPEVAYAMAQMGLRLDGVAAALDLDRGLEALSRPPPETWAP